MSLSGELATMELADVLEWIARRNKTGRLALRRRSTEKRLAFREGRLCGCGSNDPRETLGQALIRAELVSEEQLFQALMRQEERMQLLGALLVEQGVLSEDDLLQTLRANAEEVAYDTFLWADGRFEFQPGDFAPQGAVVLDMDTGRVIEEGRHRREQWEEIRSMFPSSEVTFQIQGGAYGIGDNVDRALLGLAASGKTLAAMSLETRRSRYETGLRLAALCERGALRVHQVVAGTAEADPVGTIKALLERANERLAANLFDDAFQAYEEVLALDRLNQTAKKGLVRVSDARRQWKAIRKIPLDKVPMVALGSVALTKEHFEPQEGFLLSRINGEWSVQAILKLCPIPEKEALAIMARLLDRGVITLM